MIDNLINEIEQAMLNVLDNEQLCQLRKVLDYTFRNISVTEKEEEFSKNYGHPMAFRSCVLETWSI